MSKKARILCVGSLVGASCAVAWLLLRSHEPVFEGERLSFWLQAYDDGELTPQRQKADNAVRHIGTNAIPTLLRLLQQDDSVFKLQLIGLAQKQHFLKITHVPAYVRHREAMDGISALGAEAKDAVPVLIHLYERNPPHIGRATIALALAAIGPAAKSAVPSLLRGLDDPDMQVRRNAAAALGSIHAEADLVLPELIKCLSNLDTYGKQDVAHALGRFGAEAKPAVPALVELLGDKDEGVRRGAERALKRIDPEAAVRAGVNVL